MRFVVFGDDLDLDVFGALDLVVGFGSFMFGIC